MHSNKKDTGEKDIPSIEQREKAVCAIYINYALNQSVKKRILTEALKAINIVEKAYIRFK